VEIVEPGESADPGLERVSGIFVPNVLGLLPNEAISERTSPPRVHCPGILNIRSLRL